MKKFILHIFALIALSILHSCATQKDFSSSSVFQKRRHLKGYHLNIKTPEFANRKSRPIKNKQHEIQENTSINPPTVLSLNESIPQRKHNEEERASVILQKQRQDKVIVHAEVAAKSTAPLPSSSFKPAFDIDNNSTSLLKIAQDETKKEKLGLGKLSFFMHLTSVLLNVLLAVWLVIIFTNRFDFWLGIELSMLEIVGIVSIGIISTFLSIGSLVLAIIAVIQYSSSEKELKDKRDLTFALIRLVFFFLSILAFLLGPVVFALI